MSRKIWGVLLSVVQFAMYPLSASAAPMTEAPVTSDQMVQISNGAMAGVTSFRFDHMVISDITNSVNPKLSGTGLTTKQIIVGPNVVHQTTSDSMTVAGRTKTEYTDQYIVREGGNTKVYMQKNGRAWVVMLFPDNGKTVDNFRLPQLTGMTKPGVGQSAAQVYTDGEVFQFTEILAGNKYPTVFTFDAVTMLPVGLRLEMPAEADSSGLVQTGTIEMVISDFGMYDTLTVPPEVVASAVPLY